MFKFLKQITKKGFYTIKKDGDNGRYICIYTSFINVKPNESTEIAYKFLHSGSTILFKSKKILQVELPEGWMHLKLDKENEIIVDDCGRKRVEINVKTKDVTFLRRFKHHIQIISESDPETNMKFVINVSIIIVDYDIPVYSYNIGAEKYYRALKFFNDDEDKLLKKFEEDAIEILTQHYPHWEDELAYW